MHVLQPLSSGLPGWLYSLYWLQGPSGLRLQTALLDRLIVHGSLLSTPLSCFIFFVLLILVWKFDCA